MRNLIEFLAKHNHWIVFIILEAISFILLFRYNSYQGSVWFSSANVVAGKVYELSSQLETFFTLTSANEKLTERNLLLERKVTELAEQLTTLTKDSSYLKKDLKQLSDYHLIPAKIVSNSLDRQDNLITLNKGCLLYTSDAADD